MADPTVSFTTASGTTTYEKRSGRWTRKSGVAPDVYVDLGQGDPSPQNLDRAYESTKPIVVQQETKPVAPTQQTQQSEVRKSIGALPDLQRRLAQDLINTGKFNLSKQSDVAALQTALFISKIETNFSYDSAYTSTGGSGNSMLGPWQFNTNYTGNLTKKQQLDRISDIVLGISLTPSSKGRFDPNIAAKYLQNAKTSDDIRRAIIAGGLTSTDFDPLDNPPIVRSRSDIPFTNNLLQIAAVAVGANTVEQHPLS